ncbi:MAG: tRNA (adenosine(37)-N6)-dimethylallyltransferase MiaA [Gammaproteobacteria bacterium]|nr:MAG: tRNA (adenosine(37)-N6)-dimethylallyltransferase MiaA [Gammaproteobacteria bacterium]
MGPTATGKSALGLALADRLGGEIISVDSALVYRGMDIGTAKPTAVERRQVPHHLIDVADPADAYSAARFREDAITAMQAIDARGRLPLLVGGTMLYFRALLQGLSPLPPRDPALRARLDAQAAVEGWPALHARLAELDPEAAARIQPRDAQRIQRAMEVATLTGQPLSGLQSRQPGPPAPWQFLIIALIPGDRGRLAADIAARFDRMMERGLLEEVRALYGRDDLDEHTPALRAVGYRQLIEHLAGRCSLAAARERAVIATRQLARRQLVWLRREQPDQVLEPFAGGVAEAVERRVIEAAGRVAG